MNDETTTPPDADQASDESQETKAKSGGKRRSRKKRPPKENAVDVLRQEFAEAEAEASAKGLPANRVKARITARAAELGVPLSEVFDDDDDE